MTEFKSNPVVIKASQEKIYCFLEDFRNFNNLLPDQIENWNATHDKCSFRIKGLADIELYIKEREPLRTIVIESNPKPIPLRINHNIELIDENYTKYTVTIEVELNGFLSMVVANPLKNLVNVISERLKNFMESS